MKPYRCVIVCNYICIIENECWFVMLDGKCLLATVLEVRLIPCEDLFNQSS